jgi:predicted small lipoprotein YifL
MRIACLLAAVALTGTLFACGQKGPLVLPDAQRPHKKIGIPKTPAAPAPQPATPQAATPQPTAPTAPAPAAPQK